MNNGLTTCIQALKNEMSREGISPENGLGTELFHFATTLTPLISVDLLVVNAEGEFLLSWRDDPHCGRGWHVPGGCIRLGETFERRIQETAKRELGIPVQFDSEPIRVLEYFAPADRIGVTDQRERSHIITLVFLCEVPETYDIPAVYRAEQLPGSIRWFHELPVDCLPLQECYWKNWNELMTDVRRKRDVHMA